MGGGWIYSYPMVFTVTLPNFPEWAIPMSKIIVKGYTSDGFVDEYISGANITCQHTWNVINTSTEKSIQLKIELDASIGNSQESVPIYIDLDLVFINERIVQEINPNKS